MVGTVDDDGVTDDDRDGGGKCVLEMDEVITEIEGNGDGREVTALLTTNDDVVVGNDG